MSCMWVPACGMCLAGWFPSVKAISEGTDMKRQRSISQGKPSLILYTNQLIDDPVSRSARSSRRSKLHQFRPREVADELSLMDAELLRKICPEELEGCAWMKHDKYTRAPNIMAMIRASNELAMLVPTEVLNEQTPTAMARCISAFIKIASQCYCQNNLNSLKAILAGLQCTPVHRLKQTWREIPAKRKRKFDRLSQLMSEEYNWRAYRKHLNKLLEETTPCIPFLGVLLTTTVQTGSSASGRRSRKASGVEDYTVLEAITVRNRLETIRHLSSSWRRSLPPWFEKPPPQSPPLEHDSSDTAATILGTSEATPTILGQSLSESEDSSDCEQDCDTPPLDVGNPPMRVRRGRVWSEAVTESEEAHAELTVSRSYDGLKDACTNWGLIEEFPEPMVRAPSVGSLSSTCTSSASSGESSSSLPITNGIRPGLTPPAHSPEPPLDPLSDPTSDLPSDLNSDLPSNSTFDLPTERRSRSSCISITQISTRKLSVVTRSKRGSHISLCSIDIPPAVLTRRRRPSTLLNVLHASSAPTEHLACYQLLSLGCSAGIHGNPTLRAVITGDRRNTEGANYRLSYLREPS